MQPAVEQTTKLKFANSPDKPSRRKYSRLTKEKQQEIVELAENNPNLSHQDIATLEDCERSTVTRVLQQYNVQKSELDDYKNNRADILAGFQQRILKSITPEEIQKAPMGSRVLAVAQLYDKERLERGQSTENVSVLVAAIQDIKARKANT